MTTPNLAIIERVDLRETWEHEAYDFTPWLADNIAELGEALKMNLQFIQKEAPVGSFSLDILAVDLDSNRHVIIENQLGDTDHTHLGQLLTYAAWFDAEAVVWVTREFRDEHRQALDWLNQRTGEDTQFFGVEVELWRIGESLPAPHFKTVATPNDWVKRQKSAIPVTDGRQTKLCSWRRELIEALRKDTGLPSRRNIEAKATWLLIERPIPDIMYAATWRHHNPGVEMIVHREGEGGRDWNQRIFDALEADKPLIEASLVDQEKGEWCHWQETEHRQGSRRIVIYRNGNVFEEPELRAEFCDWIVQKLKDFHKVFTPRLRKLIKQEQHTIE